MKKGLTIACLVALATTIALPAHGKESTPPSTKTRKAKVPKAPVNTGYGETRKERDQRLLRECRGKPNAGACEGYAS